MKKKPKEEPIRTRKPSRSSDKPLLAHSLPSSSSGEDQGRFLWSCSSSPWSDPYEVIPTSRVSEQVKALVQLKAAQVKADAISMSKVGGVRTLDYIKVTCSRYHCMQSCVHMYTHTCIRM